MHNGTKRWIIAIVLACVVALVVCTVYYIYHPEEAAYSIEESMNALDSE